MKNDKKVIEWHETLKQAALNSTYMKEYSSPQGYMSFLLKDCSGLNASVYINGDNVIISFAGTNTHSPKDISNDVQLLSGITAKQAHRALDFYNSMVELLPDKHITLTGYSLGGGLGQYVSAKTGAPAVTFYPLGVANLFQEGDNIKTENIINYCNPKDFVSAGTASRLLGKCYVIETNEALGKGNHKLKYAENLENRRLVTKEQLQEEFFEYSGIKKVKNTIKDSKKYIKQIYNKVESFKPSLLNTEFFVNTCTGTYPVSGYTRDDGTKVEGYTRTCGAKHLSTPHKKRFDEMTDAEIDKLIDERIKAKWR